jgi:8-oxo-dGTP pyrophosphatase MutT (NUDIX family)
MSPFRPDLVDCWIFRVPEIGAAEDPAAAAEILLIRRTPGRILPGLWQCISGSIEADERVAIAALREVEEETGFGPSVIEAFYDLDLVNHFHEPSVDAVMTSAVFALRIDPSAEVRLSHEHDGARWLPLQEARREAVWPGYREAIDRIRENLFDPNRAPWFELDLGGRRRVD